MGSEMQNNSQPTSSRIALIIVILALLVAAYFYFGKNESMMLNREDNQSAQNNNNPDLPPLTEDELAALNFPQNADSQEAIIAHAGAVRKIAVAGKEVMVGAQCRTSPTVLSLKKGEKISFKNIDRMNHVISFNKDRSVLVAPGETATMSMEFGEVEHLYGYGCESIAKPIGVVLIVE
jgi:plastocyanin